MAEFLLDKVGHRKGFLILTLYWGDMDKHKTNTNSGYEEQDEGVQVAYPGVGALWYVCLDEVDHIDQDSNEDSNDKRFSSSEINLWLYVYPA